MRLITSLVVSAVAISGIGPDQGAARDAFTKAGKFVMQIGRAGQSQGNADTRNLNQPADTFVYAKTNELFVADGYGNRRVIVFDATTGAFKRMWGAFGNPPTDAPPNPALPDADVAGSTCLLGKPVTSHPSRAPRGPEEGGLAAYTLPRCRRIRSLPD